MSPCATFNIFKQNRVDGIKEWLHISINHHSIARQICDTNV